MDTDTPLFVGTFKGAAANFAARAVRGEQVAKTLLAKLLTSYNHVVFASTVGDKVIAFVAPAGEVIDETTFNWTSEVTDQTAAMLIAENKGCGEIMPGLRA